MHKRNRFKPAAYASHYFLSLFTEQKHWRTQFLNFLHELRWFHW